MSGLGVVPKASEIAVEDYVNYHRHEIARPKAGEAVGLDLRWLNSSVSKGGAAVLQVGLSTALINDRQSLRPVNLSLVIDRSGSMAAEDKMSRVHAALIKLVGQLRDVDTLSIVTFSTDAQVLLPATRVGERKDLVSMIRGIEPSGSTNINAGLMLGYEEALKSYRKDATNRVVLLTDGIANVGVTDPAEISKGSLTYNDRGIDLSTIGVGQDLNQDLLSRLAKSGRGLYHFVADAQDIEKVFTKEAQSLLSPVATEPNLRIEVGQGLVLEQVFGYGPRQHGSTVDIPLDNMNSGMTQVVLLRFKAAGSESSKLSVKASVNYYDLELKRTVTKTDQAALEGGGRAREDASVAKNYTIALLAQSIKEMAGHCESEKFMQAEDALQTAMANAGERYPSMEDPDIKRTYAIAQSYHAALHKDNERRTETEGSTGPNLIFNGDFALGNVGFKSALSYISPSPNCLWGNYYTVAPRFDIEPLHTLIPTGQYAAPKRKNGNEQVLYMNTGGFDLLEVWSASVKCKPHTKYRISFQSMSLTPGRESVPFFEVRVNGARSEPQLAGEGAFVATSFEWESGSSNSANITIMRMPMQHVGRLIAIANIEMVEKR